MLLVNGMVVVLSLVTFGAEATDGKEFAAKIACCNMTEVKAGKMAAEKAENSEVKAFAEMMVREHTKAQEMLKEACKTAKLECPTEQTKEGKECCAKLEKAEKGKEFDRLYIKTQVEGHAKAIKTLEQASRDGQEGIKEYATRMLPNVREHMKKAKQIQEKLGAST